MEIFQKSFPSAPLTWPPQTTWALAGVVGSGNLEVLIEPGAATDSVAEFAVETSFPGYRDAWLAALEDFASHYALGGAKVTLHDQGAAPIVIKMRLRQALDQLIHP